MISLGGQGLACCLLKEIKMSVDKKFSNSIIALTKKGVEQAEALRELGYVAVRHAYNGNSDYAQFMMDNLTQAQRKPLYSWFKRAGLNVVTPVVGSARYLVGGIVDAKRQAKAFAHCESTPVLQNEHVVTKEPKVKPLEGTPLQRALDTVSTRIKSMREKDPDGAIALNELVQRPVMALYLENGERMALSYDELRMALEGVTLSRLEAHMSADAYAMHDARAVAESRVH